MARNVFFSFNFKRDAERVSQVRNMGVVSGQPLLTANQWEDVKEGGDKAIKQWINDQMRGKSCAVVLVGYGTAGRPWVEYEIEKAWKDGKGLVGIHIHNLKNLAGEQSAKGANPFSGFNIAGTPLSTIVKTYDPPHKTSPTSTKTFRTASRVGWKRRLLSAVVTRRPTQGAGQRKTLGKTATELTGKPGGPSDHPGRRAIPLGTVNCRQVVDLELP